MHEWASDEEKQAQEEIESIKAQVVELSKWLAEHEITHEDYDTKAGCLAYRVGALAALSLYHRDDTVVPPSIWLANAAGIGLQVEIEHTERQMANQARNN